MENEPSKLCVQVQSWHLYGSSYCRRVLPSLFQPGPSCVLALAWGKKWNKIIWCWGCKSFHYSSTQTLLPSNAQKIQSGWWSFPACLAAGLLGPGGRGTAFGFVLGFFFLLIQRCLRAMSGIGWGMSSGSLIKSLSGTGLNCKHSKFHWARGRWISRKGLPGGQGRSLLFVLVLFNSSSPE